MLTRSQARDACITKCRSHQEAERAAGRSGSLSPTWCADLAQAAEAKREFWLAAEWWNSAASVTLGGTRALRYMEAAKRCFLLGEEAEANSK